MRSSTPSFSTTRRGCSRRATQRASWGARRSNSSRRSGEKHKQLRGLVVNLMTAVKNPEGSSFFSDIDDGARRVLGSWKDGETVVLCNETRKARHQIVDILRGIMRQRENRMREREEKEKKDFLDMLLADENLAEENVLSLMLDLLLGGYETTAMLIAIAVKYLSENPEILNELKEEHIELIKNKRGERLEWDDYKKMEFTQCLISESLRLGNVVKFLHRETTKSIQFKAYKIPAGWKVLPVITGVHLDPSLHSDPSSFNPYRWKRMDTNEKSFMPFGGGKRKCPGLELARLEAAIFIHHLALRYTWIPISQSDWPISHPYLDFKDGFQIAIKSRHV
ncbi:hypothetical protein HPP92_024174 [Vanilla planifolia]|uniref:Cytochrome P450 n=1 Tax=Vanilla planifolia TaxID=51239 RepID=A0A835UEF7_VANPL|nr:hypothetical protein HPP92_024174 [Vanilla planifolia]